MDLRAYFFYQENKKNYKDKEVLLPRKNRIVYPGIAHHVTQRGTRREKTFFLEKDYVFYLKLLFKYSKKSNLEIVAYCLMPNHIHIVAIPSSNGSLSSAIGVTHQVYSQSINKREGWKGHLWQERFYSVPLSDDHLNSCVAYVHLNPVKAGFVKSSEEYRWSSAWKLL